MASEAQGRNCKVQGKAGPDTTFLQLGSFCPWAVPAHASANSLMAHIVAQEDAHTGPGCCQRTMVHSRTGRASPSPDFCLNLPLMCDQQRAVLKDTAGRRVGGPHQGSCLAVDVPLAAHIIQVGCGGVQQVPFGLPAALPACTKASL